MNGVAVAILAEERGASGVVLPPEKCSLRGIRGTPRHLEERRYDVARIANDANDWRLREIASNLLDMEQVTGSLFDPALFAHTHHVLLGESSDQVRDRSR